LVSGNLTSRSMSPAVAGSQGAQSSARRRLPTRAFWFTTTAGRGLPALPP
jgi:hypothetical protein